MKLQSGSVYMASIALESNVMAVIIKRMWWKPWRWSITPIYYSDRASGRTTGYITDTNEGLAIKDLTKEGVVGMAKLFGVTHKDFEDHMCMRTDGV